jgi:L-ascorbate metabolism protein UlaG (beta-lactamase superfamily)
MRITMIGHSTVLIEAAGARILTDPWFAFHGNPAYKRLQPPAMRREDLRNVDLVLISHNHWDHTDRRFLRMLDPGVPAAAPASRAWLTRLKGAKNVIGLRPWEKRRFGEVEITAVPARHIAVTVGFLIEAESKRVYFAGDTYFGEFMAKTGQEMRPDVALMPVTTYRIPMTMGESAALRAVRALRPATVIPIHCGLAPRSPLLRTRQTPERFGELVRAAGLPVEIVVLREGESRDFAETAP